MNTLINFSLDGLNDSAQNKVDRIVVIDVAGALWEIDNDICSRRIVGKKLA